MITGGKIIELTAKKPKEDKATSFETLISFVDFEVNGTDATVSYTFEVIYNDEIGYMKVVGKLLLKDDKKVLADVKAKWDKTKQLPVDYMQPILNPLNAEGTYDCTLVSRLLGLPAPIMIPKIKMDAPQAPAKK